MDRTHPQPIKGDVTVCDAMLAKIPVLRCVFIQLNKLIFSPNVPHKFNNNITLIFAEI